MVQESLHHLQNHTPSPGFPNLPPGSSLVSTHDILIYAFLKLPDLAWVPQPVNQTSLAFPDFTTEDL